MQLNCFYCHTPFALRREEALFALQHMSLEKLSHFDAHCPRCRRANRISRQQLEHFYPGWQEAVKGLEKEAARAEKEGVGTAAGIEKASPPQESVSRQAKAGTAAKAPESRISREPSSAPAGKSRVHHRPAAGGKSTKPQSASAGKKPVSRGTPASSKKPASAAGKSSGAARSPSGKQPAPVSSKPSPKRNAPAKAKPSSTTKAAPKTKATSRKK